MGTTSDGDRPWESYHTVYTNAKAGMDGVDKERVQRVIYEMSKGSKYFENEQRKEAFLKQRIERMHAQCAKLTTNDIAHFQMIADKRILESEAARDLSKIWLHSDMDAFYAAVEMLDNPSLKGKPLAVGSMSMICTANYEARKFGVRAAMPGFIARKLCPNLVFVPTNFDKYMYYSEMTRKVFRRYDPYFIATSLDEAYLNITDVCKERGVSSQEVAEELRNAIFEETSLTCSAGVAPNRLLAKVCSDINKPNGQFILPNERKAIMAFISSLPIRKIGGIGKVTEHILRDVLGINTCEEMLKKSAYLCALFSPCSIDFFISAALGLGSTDTPQFSLRKSMSSERTFSGTEDQSLLYQKLDEIADSLSNDMQIESLFGRTLTLKLKTASFEVRTRALSLQKYIQSKEDILSHATRLLKAELPLSLRLIGLRMSHFRDDKHGSGDPMQKTITSFIFSGDASENVLCDNHSAGTDTSDDPLIGNDLCFQDDQNVPSLGSRHPELVDEQCFNNDVDGWKKIDGFKSSAKTDEMEMYSRTESNVEVNETGKFPDNRAVYPSTREGLAFWIDDYICSLCGCELPPSFIEERQEHSDYHLAEMLQKEESTNNLSKLMQERPIDKGSSATGTSRKRQKSSPKGSKHIPIDFFFKRNKEV
uniref:DNA polymerase kappa n=1 Tax=Anthurium amnicola TaxID=1678845 RepID=A0A1D1ZAP8_9ARAE